MNKNIKVGVITYHCVPNFGALLQAWSICNLLSRWAAKVEIFDYRSDLVENSWKRSGPKRFLPSPGQYKMKKFVNGHLPVTRPLYSLSDLDAYVRQNEFDAIICGSDEIWRQPDSRDFEPAYFLGFGGEGLKRISYAPSCGDLDTFGENADHVSSLLRGFTAMSVRDQRSRTLVQQLGFDDVEIVCDPTLLGDLDRLVSPTAVSEPYLAIVGQMDNHSLGIVKSIARSLDLKTVAIATKVAFADRELKYIDPKQWAGLLAGANFVATSLFHGAALAIRFNVPFVAFGSGGRSVKLQGLLEQFGLSDRYLGKDVLELSGELHLLDLDEDVPRKLENFRKRSLQYLGNNFNG